MFCFFTHTRGRRHLSKGNKTHCFYRELCLILHDFNYLCWSFWYPAFDWSDIGAQFHLHGIMFGDQTASSTEHKRSVEHTVCLRNQTSLTALVISANGTVCYTYVPVSNIPIILGLCKPKVRATSPTPNDISSQDDAKTGNSGVKPMFIFMFNILPQVIRLCGLVAIKIIYQIVCRKDI
jgi:hypothetical protein